MSSNQSSNLAIVVIGAATAMAAFALPRRAVAAVAAAVGIKARGERNNNPGNIEWIADASKRHRGMIGQDGRYGVFDTIENGVRAIGNEIKASSRKGQRTILAFISEQSPEEENPTLAYAENVAKYVGVGATEDINLVAYGAPIAYAVIRQELGYSPWTFDQVKAWVFSP